MPIASLQGPVDGHSIGGNVLKEREEKVLFLMPTIETPNPQQHQITDTATDRPWYCHFSVPRSSRVPVPLSRSLCGTSRAVCRRYPDTVRAQRSRF